MNAEACKDDLLHLSQALDDQRNNDRQMRGFERRSLATSMAYKEDMRRRMKTEIEEEKTQDQVRVKAACDSLQRENEARLKARQEESIECQMAKEQREKLQALQQAEEKRADAYYARAELDKIDTMLQKNSEFMESIRHRLDKYGTCQSITEGVHNEALNHKNRTDYLLVHKPYDDRLKAELLKERQQLEDVRQKRSNLSACLLRQIEQGNLEKNQKLYNEIQEEHRLLTQELQQYDVKQRQKKTLLCEQMKQTLETLQKQIERRQQAMKETENMSPAEVQINNPKDPENRGYQPVKTLQAVPGFANQYDKMLMNAYLDKVVDLDSKNLQNSLAMTTLANNTILNKSTRMDRRSTLDNIGREGDRLPPISEYEFIRNRHKKGVFNIITNNRR